MESQVELKLDTNLEDSLLNSKKMLWAPDFCKENGQHGLSSGGGLGEFLLLYCILLQVEQVYPMEWNFLLKCLKDRTAQSYRFRDQVVFFFFFFKPVLELGYTWKDSVGVGKWVFPKTCHLSIFPLASRKLVF